MALSRSYVKEIRENLNYTATWLPNLHLSLGDVGVLSADGFSYRTNLANLGIPFTEGKPGASAAYRHTSDSTVRTEIKLAGKAPAVGSVLADADAGISFAFSGKDAVVFRASNCTTRVIADQEPLKKAILTAFHAGKWEKDYVVITEVVSAGKTTIVISQGAEGRYELKAKAGVVPTLDALNADGSFDLVNESQIGFNCLAAADMTPLFRCLGVRVGWFRTDVSSRDAAPPGPPAPGAKPNDAVVEVEYEDYLAAGGA